MLFTFPFLWPITMIFLHHAQTSPQHLFMCCLSTYTFLLSLVTFLIIVCLHFLFISNWITSIIFVIFLYNGTLYYFSQHAFPAFSPTCDTASRCVHMCKRTVLQLHVSRAFGHCRPSPVTRSHAEARPRPDQTRAE